MSHDGDNSTSGAGRRLRLVPRRRRQRPAGKPKIKKLRLISILFGLSLLAVVSTVFGMMMAVASQLPDLENAEQYRSNKNNSVLLDYRGRRLGIMQNNENVVLVGPYQIAPAMKHAIIAIEDKRFYTNSGFDLRGIVRAVWADLTAGGAVQGASTITQQFVKNALEAQNRRTLFQKLKEAALAYHLTRKWTKEKILTEYLNQVYFGNGAHGVEAAARVYFGKRHGYGEPGGCGSTPRNMCADQLTTPEAALIAAVVASPSAYDPIANPDRARARRDLVLRYMHEQGYIDAASYRDALQDPLPRQEDLTPPQERTEAPYFTSWVRQQVVDHFGAFKAFSGDLEITTTLDLDMQVAAENVINELLPPDSGLPSAALVAIDNDTGEVRAMVGGTDYARRPFNLATQGQRQPGSTFKPFTLVAALQSGISPDAVFTSAPREFPVPGTKGREAFVVRNYNDSYAGALSLASATTTSDNSVYAEVGIKVGTRKIARVARKMGIRTPISTNLAMTLGGLRQGVTPLDMAHAYQTFATGGKRVWNDQLGAPDRGPIGIHMVRDGNGRIIRDNRRTLQRKQVIDPQAAATAKQILQTVVAYGTGTAAQLDDAEHGVVAGKTGTTENYGDAWFVGFNDELTVAVWVGYPDRLEPMLTSYHGEPVAGGTYPAEIWRRFMEAAMDILDRRRAEAEALKQRGDREGVSTTPDGELYETPDVTPSPDSSTADGAGGDTGGGSSTGQAAPPQGAGGDGGGGGGGAPQTPAQPTPAPAPAQPTPAPAPAQPTPAAPAEPTPPPASATPAPSGGGDAGAGGGAAAPTG